MQEICLVIPCYNEAGRLRGNEILDFIERHERASVCLVNDGSSDATLNVLEALKKTDPEKILVVSLPNNHGKAEAVRQGVIHVSSLRRFAFIGYWDADLSTPLRELEHILSAFTFNPGCRLAMGSRVKRLGAHIERRATRHVFGRIFSTFSSRIVNLPVYDSQCGAKVFRSEMVEVLFRDLFITRWLFDVEILARLRNHLGQERALTATTEVPLDTWSEVGGSKLRIADLLTVPFELLKIYWHYNRRPPMHTGSAVE